MVLYLTSHHIVGYEVSEGSLSVDNIYTGLALRDEYIIRSVESGYINYYAREGTRVANGDLIYSVDSTGKLTDFTHDNPSDNNTLSASDLSELKTEISGFAHTFRKQNFSETYDLKSTVEGMAMKLANYRILDNIDDLTKNGNSDLVSLGRAAQSGIVVYSIDGFENFSADSVNLEVFNQEDHPKTQLISGALIAQNDPSYKLCVSEDWSVFIPVTQEKGNQLLEAEYVKVRFLKDQNESWAEVKLHENADGCFAELIFNNSMITFCTDRYIDIELITETEKGLKVPNSAIVEQEFFLLPEDYVMGSNSSGYFVLKESFNEDGKNESQTININVYNNVDGEYYVNSPSLQIGDYIIKKDSQEKFPISKRARLIGVYNINKGYADFREIEVLYSNDDYSIVKSGTTYGLSVYDHIVLDASSVNDNDFVLS